MTLFVRTLPLVLALVALLALPIHLESAQRSPAKLLHSLSSLQAFVSGDTTELEGFTAPQIEATDWSADRFSDQWVPILDGGSSDLHSNPELVAIVRATELPIDAYLARSRER